MRKSELIARVLINAGFKATLEEAEFHVRKIFEVEFPGENIHEWNTVVAEGQKIVNNIGKQTRVNVRSFILDLWENKRAKYS